MEDNTFVKVVVVGLFALLIWGVTALLQAQGESARRARLVIGGALLLVLAWGVFTLAGPVGFLVIASIIGAITWVVKGSKK